DVASRGLYARTRSGELLQGLGYEFLAAETGIDRHDQNEIELANDVIEIVERCRGVEDQARFAAVVPDETDGAVHVVGSFRMKRDDVRASLGEIGDDAVHRAH